MFTSTEKVTVLAQPFAYDAATLDIENGGSFLGSLLDGPDRSVLPPPRT